MKTKAVRLYGVNDLRLEEFELPEIRDDEILARVVSDSICMSTYKATLQGPAHKRVPDDVASNPVIVGHEFCGDIIKVGNACDKKYKVGSKFAIQPAINDPTNVHAAPGYSFKYIGGASTYIIIPSIVMERSCLMDYTGDAYYMGSLAEPVSCIVGGFNVNYHSAPGSYVHNMGIAEGGKMALLAGVGPMGLGAIDYAIHCERRPSLLVVTDIDEARLKRAAQIYTVEEAARNGVKLVYMNTSGIDDVVGSLRALTDGTGFDDVYVYAPVRAVLQQASEILGYDGCLNFFAGPTDPKFSAEFNFYNVHYMSTHVAGNSGGNNDDLIEALDKLSRNILDPSAMVTHIGGLDAVIETTKNLPKIPGGKKLIYTQISMPLTAISDFRMLGEANGMFLDLADIVEKNNGLWCHEAERYLLERAKPI
ncbi:MAG: zinc-binding dehydrogenase [Oscillospiraceae bacterium]|nr:zinc-binding dehydrogenase [Oscillospiraceae bacterium]MDD4413343.1 zinc-binding dehydrogenase [Oscillospiraceae bacterium]